MSPRFPFYLTLSATGFSVALLAYRLALLFQVSAVVFILFTIVLLATMFSLYELWLSIKELFGIDVDVLDLLRGHHEQSDSPKTS